MISCVFRVIYIYIYIHVGLYQFAGREQMLLLETLLRGDARAAREEMLVLLLEERRCCCWKRGDAFAVQAFLQACLFRLSCRHACSGIPAGMPVQAFLQACLFRRSCRHACSGIPAGMHLPAPGVLPDTRGQKEQYFD